MTVVPILALTLYGQAFYGSVVGTITDQPAAALSGVTVTRTNVGTGEVPGAGGDDQFLSLVPGMYRIDVEQGGFKKATRDNPANSAPRNLVNIAPSLDSISGFRVQGALAIATDQTARLDVNLKVGTVGATVVVAPQAAQIQAGSSAVTNATDAQVINDVPNVTQNPLFYAMLQNGVQPRNETSTSTLGDL